MPTNSRKTNPTIADPEISDGGIANSSADVQRGSGSTASSAELALALQASQAQVKMLERQLAAKASEDSKINDLVSALAAYLPQKAPQPSEIDNINRTADFQNQRATVDGRSLMEAQQALMSFRNEEKLPISISKTVANFVGANLVVTVNGVRVSIPCDGRTYYINKSHWEHARERLAKIDLLNANTEPQIVVMGE